MDKTTLKRSFRLSVAVGAVLLLVFVAGAAWEWWQSRRQPSREPDFIGRIVATGGPGYLLESPQGGKFWIRPPAGERIRTRGNELGTLAVGQTVRVWDTGLTRGSYPPQGDAVWIIIEDDKP
jgi:hypothetical protein